MNFGLKVKLKLVEKQNMGIRVPVKAFAMTSDNRFMQKYESMDVNACADLLVNIAQLA